MPHDVASMHFVNPLTALGLHDKVKSLKASACIQTGAASQLGRMLIKICKQNKTPLINIVRRDEQITLLKEQYGAEIVLNSNAPNFKEDFTKLCKEMKATALIECVAGETTGQLMECLPSRSTVIFYGALSEKGPCDIDPLILIGRSYKIEGFVLGQYITKKGLGIIGVIKQCNALMADKTVQSNIQKKFGLKDFQSNIPEYYKNMTGGKFVLEPHEGTDELTEDGEVFDIMAFGTE